MVRSFFKVLIYVLLYQASHEQIIEELDKIDEHLKRFLKFVDNHSSKDTIQCRIEQIRSKSASIKQLSSDR